MPLPAELYNKQTYTIKAAEQFMKLSNHIAVLVLTLLSSVFANAQDIKAMLGQVQGDAKESFVTLEYAAEVSGADGQVKDKGIIEAQDDMWHLKGSLLEIYTDASGTWILDSSAKEAYVEPAWTYDDLLTFYESVAAAGSELTVKVLKTALSEKRPASFFTPALSSDWILTDLR